MKKIENRIKTKLLNKSICKNLTNKLKLVIFSLNVLIQKTGLIVRINFLN